MRILASHSNEYKVGLTGQFDKNIAYTVYDILAKLNQIHLYCKKWRKPVIIYVDEKCPAYLYKFMNTQGYKIIPVLKGEDNRSSYNEYAPDIHEFMENTCDVVVIVCTKEGKHDFEFDTEKSYVRIKKEIPHSRKPSKTIENPNENVRSFVKKANKDGDPYSAFSHEPLWERIPYNHWNEVMDTMEDNRDNQNRQFV